MVCANEIWVYVETDDNGAITPSALELVSAARELADSCGLAVAAVLLGRGLTDCPPGVGRVIMVDDPRLAERDAEVYAHALCSVIKDGQGVANALVMAATAWGRDLAPRVACRLDVGLTADCTGLRWDAALGRVVWTRPTFGGKLMAEIVCGDRLPHMGTLSLGAFEPWQGREKPPIIERPTVDFSNVKPRTVTVKKDGNDARDVEALGTARVILAGGKGLGADGFRLLEELARRIGVETAASRAAVEAGWVSATRQVGQSGQTVRPEIYMAFGVSGAIQHLAGIGGAKKVVAVNADPDAPIFRFADVGVVGDAKEILSEMIKRA